MTFGSSFWKKGQYIHILWCIFKSNITMIAKVCDCESRRDSWFENCLVFLFFVFNYFSLQSTAHSQTYSKLGYVLGVNEIPNAVRNFYNGCVISFDFAVDVQRCQLIVTRCLVIWPIPSQCCPSIFVLTNSE